MPFVKYKQPCSECGGSDPVSVNDDGSAYCFSCNTFFPNYDGTSEVQPKQFKDNVVYDEFIHPKMGFNPLTDRGISKETCKTYGVMSTIDGREHSYPYYSDSLDPIAHKIRKPEKQFAWTGRSKDERKLFGEQLFTKGGKFVTLFEGECDAMAGYQMTGSKYPCVSITGAAAGLKDCKSSYEFLDSFANIVVCFDGDKAGQKAALEVAELFGGKTSIVKHTEGFKDACDYLSKGKSATYVNLWWNAEKFTPEGIARSSELYNEVMADLEMPFCSYPWDCLNLMLYGMRKAELVTLTAGTGVGKSTVVKQIQEEIFNHTTEKVGVLSLEESVATAALGLMSLSANKLLHLPTQEQMKRHILKDPANIYRKPKLALTITQEEKEEAFKAMLSNDRFLFLRHVGKHDMESVLNKIRYLAKAEDCGVIVLDHISILVGMAMGIGSDERKAIDAVMHNLRAVVEETGVTLIAISHLSKAGGNRDSHEEGGRVRLGDLRGSNAIAQLSNIAIALEGNRQADDPEERNMTIVRVLKNRFSGETGVAGYLKYDSETGRLNEVDDYDCGEVL